MEMTITKSEGVNKHTKGSRRSVLPRLVKTRATTISAKTSPHRDRSENGDKPKIAFGRHIEPTKHVQKVKSRGLTPSPEAGKDAANATADEQKKTSLEAEKPGIAAPIKNITAQMSHCKTNFSMKVDTKFGIRHLPSPRVNRVRKFTGGKTKKSANVTEMSIQESLAQQLQEAKSKLEELEDMEKENIQLKESIKDNDIKYQEMKLNQLKENERLQGKIDECEKRFILCNIDPVTLHSRELSEKEQEQMDKIIKDKRENLHEKLKTIGSNSELLLESLEAIISRCDTQCGITS